SGTAFSPYSVSPLRRDHTVGPNPTMYWVTLTPNFFAGTRRPTSCRPIYSSSPTAKMSTPRAYSTAAHSSLGLLCDDGPRPRARPVLHIFDVFDGTWVPRGSVVIAQPVHQYVPNCVHDAQKRHMSGMKGGDEFLVGGVV